MPDEILARIEREAGVPGLAEILGEQIAPTDLQSLLLAVARRRAAGTSPADVLRKYETDRFVRPADVDPGRLDELERCALSLLPADFERLVLSPVCPLGTSSVLGGVSQDWVVTAVRGGEVVSDPTNVLALECGVRRRSDRTKTVRLCACHRTLRAQAFAPPFSQHFRLLALCAAGRAGDADELLAEQIEFYVRFLEAADVGPVAVDREPRKGNYYSDATFGMTVAGAEIVEGGLVDWTQTLLSDRKERLLVSGIGIELLARITG
jgi:hypothetical protein